MPILCFVLLFAETKNSSALLARLAAVLLLVLLCVVGVGAESIRLPYRAAK